MKKCLLVVSLIFFAFKLYAQKLEKIEVDKITGDTTYRTSSEVLANKFSLLANYLAASLIRTKNEDLIDFKVIQGGGVYFSTEPGEKAYIKFNDGKVIQLVTKINTTASVRHSEYGSTSEDYIYYPLGDDDLKSLKTGVISVIRIETTKGNFDYDISGKKSLLLQKEVQLISSTR